MYTKIMHQRTGCSRVTAVITLPKYNTIRSNTVRSRRDNNAPFEESTERDIQFITFTSRQSIGSAPCRNYNTTDNARG